MPNPDLAARLAALEREFHSAKVSGQWERWIYDGVSPWDIPPWRRIAEEVIRARAALGGDVATIAGEFFDSELSRLETELWRRREEARDPLDFQFVKIRELFSGAPLAKLRAEFVDFVRWYEPKGNEAAQVPSQTASASSKGRPGPKRDLDTARRVLEIVNTVAGGGDWKTKLYAVCDALDEAEIPCPKTWCKRDPPILKWADATKSTERDLAKKATAHWLKIAQS
jgi:hypothetical protein